MEDEATEKIIGCFYRVYNSLGWGFSERIFEEAMAVEFDACGISYARQVPLKVIYRDKILGDYFADFIVGDVIVELKAIRELCGEEGRQLMNYLKAGGFCVGLVLNFGKKAEVKRRDWSGKRVGVDPELLMK